MKKTDAIEKVLSLTKVRDRTNHEGERAAAQGRIDRLRKRFDIHDDELVEEDPDAFFGVRPDHKIVRMYQERARVKRTLDFILTNIEREVDKAFGNLSDLDPEGQAIQAADFYRSLNSLMGNSTAWTWKRKQTIKDRRDAAIKLAYEDAIVQAKLYMSKTHDGVTDFNTAHWRHYLHEYVHGTLARAVGMRVTDVDRIVGVRTIDLYNAAVTEEETEDD